MKLGVTMFTKNQTARTLTGAVLAGALAMGLAGCANPIDKLVEKGAQAVTGKAIEKITGGEAEVSMTSVPKDFPSEIPLPKGKLVTAMKISESFQLVYEADDSAAAAYLDTLVSMGYEETGNIETDGGFIKAYSTGDGDGWFVGVSGDLAGSENTLAVMVYKDE